MEGRRLTTQSPFSGKPGKFRLEPFVAIRFEPSKEWLVKRRIPRQGVAALYGAPESFKSFIAFDGAMHISLGWEWTGRKTSQAPAVYIAAEGAAGIRKRKIGFEKAYAGRIPADVPFFLVAAAPNLGTEKGDLEALIAAVVAAEVDPGIVVIDTLAQSLGGGDENGAGMMTFVSNATELANRLKCCVLVVHHAPLADERRMRGHTSLHGAVDVQILTERHRGAPSTTLTIEKMKDEESHVSLTAHLSRVVIGTDEDGDEVSTLIVERIEDGAAAQTRAPSTSVPRGRRLLMDVVAQAIGDEGEDFRSFHDGPLVRAAKDQAIRIRYYARIAEKAEPDEDADKLAERQRKGFNRAIAAALSAKDLIARQHDGTRFVWLP
jgi:AAA domain